MPVRRSRLHLSSLADRACVRLQIRRWFDDQTRGLFTLTTKDRQILSPAESKVAVPDRRTPIEFFKENGVRGGAEKDGKAV